MILIAGGDSDPCVSGTRRRLAGESLTATYFDPRHLLKRMGLAWESSFGTGSSLEGWIAADERRIPLESVTGVLSRLHPGSIGVDPSLSPADRRYVRSEFWAVWIALLNALPCVVINRPSHAANADRRASPADTTRARESGFRIPETLVTSREDEAIEFYGRCDGRAFGSARSGRSERILLKGPPGENRLREFLQAGTIAMVEAPEGREIEVFIVADRTMAGASESAADPSMPFPPAKLRPIALTAGIEERCVRMAGSSGAEFSCLSIIETDDSPYYVEASDGPDIEGCDETLQREIVDALANRLSQSRSD
jgi:hypothetical protein